MQGHDVSNISAYGWEWTENDSGTRFQIMQPRGTSSLHMGSQCLNGAWVSGPISNPERFGVPHVEARNAGEWHAIVAKWFGVAS